jgi:O-antigen/teichoic acid export membrane protein
MNRRSVDAGLVLAGQVLGLGLSFLAGLVAARVFEPALRGEYALLTTVAAFVSVLAGLGFAEAIVFFYRRGEADAGSTARSILLVNGVTAALVLAAGVALCPWLAARYFPAGGASAAWAALGAGLLGIVVRNGLVFLQARGDFLRSSAFSLLQPALFVAALAAIGLFGGTFAAAVGAFLLSFAVPSALLVTPLLRPARAAALDRAHLGRVTRFSLKSYANVALSQLNYRVDIFVVGALVPDLARLADYHIACTVAGLLWILPDAYGTAIYPRLAGLATPRERSAETVLAIRVVLAPVLLLALGLVLAAPWLLPFVFGASYAGSVPLTLWLLPGVVGMSVSKLLSRYFLSSDRQQIAALGMAAGVAVKLLALFAWLPAWGITAASLAASAGYLATLLLCGAAFLFDAELRRDDFREFPAREVRVGLRLARDAWRSATGDAQRKLPGSDAGR